MSKKNGPEPFFRPTRGRWYVQYRGRQYNLGADEAAARVRCHQILGGAAAPAGRSEPPPRLACEVADLYLDWCTRHRSPRTAEWYGNHLQSFLDSLPDAATLPADAVRPFHVLNWVAAHPTWGPMHARGAITSVQRAFAWAEKVGHIARSPVRGVEKPPPKRREQVLTPAEFQFLLSQVHDAAFADVLTFCWETGARVQEVRVIEARHVWADRGRVELPPAEAKGKKRWRVIYLTDAAAAVVARLAAARPTGPIFRNEDGNPWDAQAFNSRFHRMRGRLGRAELARRGFALDPKQVAAFAATLKPTKAVAGLAVAKTRDELLREARKKLTDRHAAKLGTKYALTSLRHSFATRMLESGVDHVTVAALLGHVDATMLSRVYSHVGQKTDYLRDELLKVSRGRAAGGAA